MTDDELRKVCQSLIDTILDNEFVDGAYPRDDDAMMAATLAFARHMQAVGGQGDLTKAFSLIQSLAESEPSYEDVEQGTFCVHCMAHYKVGPGLTYSLTHRSDCLWVQANEFVKSKL